MKILLPISSLCAALLVTATVFTSCQKEAQLVPAIATEQVVDNTTTTDRAAPDALFFSYTTTLEVDLEYRVTNANGSIVYYKKLFYESLGSTSSLVPGLNDCPRIQVRGRKQFNTQADQKVTWQFTRTGCSTIEGKYPISATSTTPWSSIPWVTIKEAACPCI